MKNSSKENEGVSYILSFNKQLNNKTYKNLSDEINVTIDNFTYSDYIPQFKNLDQQVEISFAI